MKLGFVVIYVSDVKKVIDFYTQAFGLAVKLEHFNEGVMLYGELETGGATLGFASHELAQISLKCDYQKLSLNDRPVGQTIVFEHAEVDAAYAKAIEAGATSVSSPADMPWGQRVAYLRGIEGTLIELCSPL